MQIKILIEGGNMKPGPDISQKIGPLGINLGKLIKDVNEATKQFSGMKVPVYLDIDTKTKQFTIKVATPPTTQLIIKELGINKASGEPKLDKVGNLAIEQVVNIAKQKLEDNLTIDLKQAVKTVAGTCVSMGVLIEGKHPVDIIKAIENNEFNDIIEMGKSNQLSVSPEKKEQLKKQLDEVKVKFEKKLKAKLEAQKAEEEKAEKEKEEKAKAGGEEEKKEEKAKAEAGKTDKTKPAKKSGKEKAKK